MILLDTNVLARSIEHGHLHQQAAVESMVQLASKGRALVVVPQCLTEFYSIGTRPTNGLGLSSEQALQEIQALRTRLEFRADTPEVFERWIDLAARHKPRNREVYDMRLVASMIAHGVQEILTFNDRDFGKFAEIRVVNPFDLLGMTRV